ncbi:hypothetical protein MUK42_02664 [Musa troglodytarum]|uniref:Uncharacterized protein n=1 Tax=Musa troglodytarum TaxID=320322 RepID=A0A9E7ETZ5_9LILI|nr:hypothetical protein MUK42_02664 [Musa troglodytarum]URD83980.1 hypothetical protein MUK42_02664 [Musa troglodytarum]
MPPQDRLCCHQSQARLNRKRKQKLFPALTPKTGSPPHPPTPKFSGQKPTADTPPLPKQEERRKRGCSRLFSPLSLSLSISLLRPLFLLHTAPESNRTSPIIHPLSVVIGLCGRVPWSSKI